MTWQVLISAPYMLPALDEFRPRLEREGVATPVLVLDTAAKHGLVGLTRTLAMEGGRHGITANAIVPGIIGTEAFHMANATMNERIANRTVFKRPGEPQDIANAIAFLCSDLASYITGIELNVSGGVELFVF